MLRSSLAARLMARHPVLNRLEAERVVNAVWASITMALATGRRVELRGFGAFAVKDIPQRIGRNPRTGEIVSVAPKVRVYFRTSGDIKKRLNEGTESPIKATDKPDRERASAQSDSGTARPESAH